MTPTGPLEATMADAQKPDTQAPDQQQSPPNPAPPDPAPNPAPDPPASTVVTPAEAAQTRARQASREAAAVKRDLPIDEAPSGGEYLVGEQLVNANGEPIKKGKGR
jgi:hypothetical protein